MDNSEATTRTDNVIVEVPGDPENQSDEHSTESSENVSSAGTENGKLTENNTRNEDIELNLENSVKEMCPTMPVDQVQESVVEAFVDQKVGTISEHCQQSGEEALALCSADVGKTESSDANNPPTTSQPNVSEIQEHMQMETDAPTSNLTLLTAHPTAANSTEEAKKSGHNRSNSLANNDSQFDAPTNFLLSTNDSPMESQSTSNPTEKLLNNLQHEINNAQSIIQQFMPLKPSPIVVAPFLQTSGLGLLASQYDTSSDDDANSSSSSCDESSLSEASVQEVAPAHLKTTSYRDKVIEINSESDTESEAASSDVEFVSQTEELEKIIDADALEDEDPTGTKSKGAMRVKGELILDDLPPIQDLHITVPEQECTELGSVHSIVEQLVLVDSIPGTAALNLDTVLFLDKGQKVLGEVFDVLGQVTSPIYCVRFNSNKQIKERGIEVGQKIYIAPRTEHTHFVILKDMMQLRGSDASWENDIEPTERHLDYSDDEEERTARRSLRNRDRGGGDECESTKKERPSPSPSPRQNQSVQNTRFPPRYPQSQRSPRYRGYSSVEYANHSYQYPNHPPPTRPEQSPAVFPPPFNYGQMNASWHTNYNQPPPHAHMGPSYPYPPFNPNFQPTMPFMPPSNVMNHPTYFPPPPPPQ